MPTSTLLRARVGVAGIFLVNGLAAALWVSNIPVVQQRTGVDHVSLGSLLLLLGLSAFVGIQVCGPINDRFGPRYPSVLCAVGLLAAVQLPVWADSRWTLMAALIAFGFFNGALDVSMNSAAVRVERAYERPIMSFFHAFFSLGGVIGAGLTAAALVAGLSPRVTVAAIAVTLLLVVLSLSRLTAGTVDGPAEPASTQSGPTQSGPTELNVTKPGPLAPARSRRLRVAILAAMAFALMLAEGTAYDWSALQVTERFGASDALGAIAFGAFSVTMTVGRFSADALVRRWGPVAVVRAGGAIACTGLVVVAASPWLWVTIFAWALFGIGIAAGVPQIFTASGNVDPARSGVYMARVVGVGYLGMLAGPAVIGWVSHAVSLSTALLVAAGLSAFAVLVAGSVRPPAAPTTLPR